MYSCHNSEMINVKDDQAIEPVRKDFLIILARGKWSALNNNLYVAYSLFRNGYEARQSQSKIIILYIMISLALLFFYIV